MKNKYGKGAFFLALLTLLALTGPNLYAETESDLDAAMTAVAKAQRALEQAQADRANAEAAYEAAVAAIADAQADMAEAMEAVAEAERAFDKAQEDVINASMALDAAAASLVELETAETAHIEAETESTETSQFDAETEEDEYAVTEATEEEYAVTETTETAQIDEETTEEEYSDTETAEAETTYTEETAVAAEAKDEESLSDGTYPLPATYTVRTWAGSRDCFWTIAGYSWVYGDPFQWRKLYDANKGKLPDQNDPNVIDEGIVLDIPSIKGEKREGAWDSNKTYAPLP